MKSLFFVVLSIAVSSFVFRPIIGSSTTIRLFPLIIIFVLGCSLSLSVGAYKKQKQQKEEEEIIIVTPGRFFVSVGVTATLFSVYYLVPNFVGSSSFRLLVALFFTASLFPNFVVLMAIFLRTKDYKFKWRR
ncbi:hypothetical protein FJ208_01735 [Candidatus Gribaldobacteria bacterium]|nr:hypothetical protein [Candidatus Gribaldobacteria bacterium]